ncbi:hypothetical protein HYH03_008024 [Edaphochlamys debaryana]|uniref:Tyrosine decarboxylase n=1 Tax=Edaphochlamys debaryana TaxID=47281 RepID=A0A835Y7F3_9CHLO|nr:hypothetical protein HYH03_008024 [Edaphochlamys debaryana]|eukprot:KAG2493805.1 hypothetical protein HYH03_008024 [Edaphochlamys debaryana]
MTRLVASASGNGAPGSSHTAPPAADALVDEFRRQAGAAAQGAAGERLKDYQHPVGVEEFRRMGYRVVDWVCDYYAGLGARPVRTDVKPGFLAGQLPPRAPESPESFEAVLSDIETRIMPGVTHWQHPSFFAWFPANASFPALLADLIGGALGMVGFSWASSPISTELEMAMLDWMAELCGLPASFRCNGGAGPGGGVIQGTASEAVVVAWLAARARAMRGRPPGDRLKLVAYGSDQAHSCYQKACRIVGIDHVRVLPASEAHDWALQPEALRAAMEEDVKAGLIPCFLQVSIGTTSSCAVDPVGGLAAVANEYGVWTHVDAAYAGSAALLPEAREHFGGLEAVQSYAFNPHKWLLTNFDCCCMWVADSGPLKEALSLTPVFLQGVGNALDYKDWQIPLGRRFRSLKLYFVLRMYGAEGLRSFLRHHTALAGAFAAALAADPRFELAAPQRFGLVCFRLRGASRQQSEALLAELNASGARFLIHTELGGRHTLRLAVGAAGTQLEHVAAAWAAVREAADRVLGEAGAGVEGPGAGGGQAVGAGKAGGAAQ